MSFILSFFFSFGLKAGDVPVEFEEFHLSEVQNMASEEKMERMWELRHSATFL